MRRSAVQVFPAPSTVLVAVLTGAAILFAPPLSWSQPAAPVEPPTTALDDLVTDIIALEDDASDSELAELVESEVSELVPTFLASNLDALREEGVSRVRLTHVYQAEMERTDKQIGASADSSASTSLAEKAGIPWLLGLAIENGAITQTEDKTGMTLSTSPYSLLLLGNEDTPDQYQRYEWARRLGVSAVFPLDSDGTAEDRNFDPKNFSQITAKLVVLGDRNPRSPEFAAEWNAKIRPRVEARLAADTALATVAYSDAEVRTAAMSIAKRITDRVRVTMKGPSQPAQLSHTLRFIIDEEMEAGLSAIDANEFPAGRREAMGEAARRVDAAYRGIDDEQKQLREMLDALAKTPEVSIAYSFHQKLDDTDYSEVKFLADFKAGNFDILANAAVSYNHTDATLLNSMGQPLHREGLRDASATIALETHFDNPIGFRVNDGGRNDVTVSLSGRFEYMDDQDSEMGVGQIKFVIPIATGVDLPISMTYASRSEYVNEDEVRGNFGITVDTDKLYSLSRLYSLGLRN